MTRIWANFRCFCRSVNNKDLGWEVTVEAEIQFLGANYFQQSPKKFGLIFEFGSPRNFFHRINSISINQSFLATEEKFKLPPKFFDPLRFKIVLQRFDSVATFYAPVAGVINLNLMYIHTPQMSRPFKSSLLWL